MFSEDFRYKLLQGNCLDVLKGIPDNTFDCCVTSPPYFNMRDYACEGQVGLEDTPEEYVQVLVDIFEEVRRTLKKEGTCWIVIGDSYVSYPVFSRKGKKESGFVGSTQANYQAQLKRKPLLGRHPVLKNKDLIGVPWRLAFALQEAGWYLRADVIWCLSGGTTLYAKTQKTEGPMVLKDLVRLRPETVKLWNGEKWTQVLGWSKSDRTGSEIEITLRNGETIGCTENHRWPTNRGLLKAKDLSIGDIISSCKLPEPETPNQPELIPDEIGWLIGIYLAEGSRNGDTIQISGHINEVDRHEKLANMASAYGATVHIHQTSKYGVSVCLDKTKIISAILDTYIGGNDAQTKHLRPSCWLRSNVFLKHLLDGYLDGDGHYDKKNDRWRLGFTRNYCLATNLRTLCARLGVKIKIVKGVSKCQTGTFRCFKGEIKFSESAHFNCKNPFEIVALKKARCRQCWDIAVEDEPHVFALASGVLTHNSKKNPLPEGLNNRPVKAHEYIFFVTKSDQHYYDADAIKEDADSKNSKDGKRHKRSVWSVPIKPYRGAHFAVFPEKLIEPCILAGSPKGGLVVDIFAGASTTGLVCLEHDRKYVGIELNQEYVDLSLNRLAEAERELTAFR